MRQLGRRRKEILQIMARKAEGGLTHGGSDLPITEEMEKRLEVERKKRALDSIPETVRYILSEYLAKS